MGINLAGYRYERKYLSEDYLPGQLESFLKVSLQAFKPIYYQRRVWSMYFDTPDFDYFQENVMGSSRRKKVRVRWYEHESKMSPIQLEMKTRDGEVLKKEVLKLKMRIDEASNKDLKKYVSEWLKLTIKENYNLEPVMVNSYKRKYFRSELLNMRVTIDSDLKFQTFRDWQRQGQVSKFEATILEAKYNLKQDKELEGLVGDLPLRVSKSSKYMMGVKLCC